MLASFCSYYLNHSDIGPLSSHPRNRKFYCRQGFIYSLSTTAYVQLFGLPEYNSFPPTFWRSQNLYVNQGFCKCNLSRVERKNGGRGIYDCHKPTPQANVMTVPSESINSPWLIPHFLVLQHEFKMDTKMYISTIYTQYPHNDVVKTCF